MRSGISQFIDRLFFQDFVGSINLYTLIATVFKYLFVLIVLYFIYLIARLIYLDIRQQSAAPKDALGYLHLLHPGKKLGFKAQSIYYLSEKNSLGRGRNNSIRMPYPFLSKNHLRILYRQGNFYVEDLGSSNGTKLNSQPLEGVQLLQDRDVLGVVDLEFLFVRGLS